MMQRLQRLLHTRNSHNATNRQGNQTICKDDHSFTPFGLNALIWHTHVLIGCLRANKSIVKVSFSTHSAHIPSIRECQPKNGGERQSRVRITEASWRGSDAAFCLVPVCAVGVEAYRSSQAHLLQVARSWDLIVICWLTTTNWKSLRTYKLKNCN